MENINLKTWINNKWFLLSLILLSTFVINVNYQGWNVSSRLATIQSIVEHGSLTIEESVFNYTGDKVYIDGEYYSDKPPTPSYLGAIVYGLLYYCGLSFNYEPVITYYLIVLLIIKGLYIFGLYCFYRSLEFTGIGTGNKNLILISLAFGSLLFTWSSTFNNHVIAASAIMTGFYYYFMHSYVKNKRVYLLSSLIFFALAGNSDMPMMLFYVVFSMLILNKCRINDFLIYYLLPGIVVSIPTLITNLYIHGSIMLIQIISEYFIYDGSPCISYVIRNRGNSTCKQ
jgi:4-amino-4-deoxy-L-arabinose transferase-like glycosyltransferase